ncbi:hypothetical protein [Paraliobacillus ryukyuensis]|uniref:hypothetical protein n=1 Tax=Paraliobacillus ryukyuensis TaxID=200904 RepID=UPI0009A7FA0C|nr:hypothetical protein [Paraliobacillus ryukyuensis]
MSEKVKVTKKQAEILDNCKNKTSLLRRTILSILSGKESAMYELSTDDLAKAIYIGYEVEEEYKKNDWIVVEDCPCDHIIGKVQKIKDVEHIEGYDTMYHYEDWWSDKRKTKLRHATEQEIAQEKKLRFWNGLGRYIEEYKDGDIILNPDGEIDEVREIKEDGLIVSRTFGEFEKSEAKLICPLESRLD